MTKLTKTQITIRTMNDNADKPMAEVVLLIAEANGVTEAVAKGAYRWCVNKGVAKGKIESNRGVTDAKLIKQVKLEGRQYKAKLKAKSKDAVQATVKRMKEVSAKYGVGRTARPEGDGVVDFDASEARAEVATMLEDDFAVPKFLSKDQVKAMI